MLEINKSIRNNDKDIIHYGTFNDMRAKIRIINYEGFNDISVMLKYDTVIAYQEHDNGRVEWGTWLPDNFDSYLLWELKERLNIDVPLYSE